MKRFFATLLLGALLVLTLAPTAAQEQEGGDKIVNVIFTQEPDSLNPMYTSMFFAGLTFPLYLPAAWVFDGDLNPVPVLVTDIPSQDNGGISEDGTVLTLNLRDDITWSDGEAITSEDFVFTYEMMTADANTPNSRYPYEADVVASVEAPDETTVVVNFVEPFAPWWTTIFDFVLPEHVLGPVFEEEGTLDNAEWNRAPTVGAGPFVFSEWETGSFMFFEPNANYFDDAPILDGFLIRFVEEDAAQTAALIAGDADLGTFFPYSDIEQLEAAGVTVQAVTSGYNEAWNFNVDPELGHPALQDVNVRRALILAAPRELVTETLLLGRTYPAGTFWEGTPFDNPDIEAPPHDPERAAELLDAAGWVDSNGDGVRDQDGVELSLRYLTTTRTVRQETQVIMQQALAEVGVELILEPLPADIFFNGFGQGGPVALGEFDIAQWSATSNFPDPDTSRFLCSEIPSEDNPEGNNWTRQCNPELDALFEEQARTVDFDARVAIYREITEMMAEMATWAGIWYDVDLWAYNNRVLNTALNGVTPFWNVNEWDVAE